MVKRKIAKRIVRRATAAERKRHAKQRQEVEQDLPQLRAAGRRLLQKHRLLSILTELKAAREEQGLSLADVRRLTGMERSTISRLETSKDANPTLLTLQRYADAVGRPIQISLLETTNRKKPNAKREKTGRGK